MRGLRKPKDRGNEGLSDQPGHLRKEAAETRLIADLATDKSKRETFAKFADHLKALADEVERAMAEKEIEEDR
jgi:hypothetical protein